MYRFSRISTIVYSSAANPVGVSSPEESLNSLSEPHVFPGEESQPSLSKGVFWGLVFAVPIWMLIVLAIYSY